MIPFDEPLSDRIALMKDGVIHQLGHPEALFRAPADLWAARFLDSGNILPAAVLGSATPPNRHALVPRGALRIDGAEPLSARVLNGIFIEDRFVKENPKTGSLYPKKGCTAHPISAS